MVGLTFQVAAFMCIYFLRMCEFFTLYLLQAFARRNRPS